jgi:heat shock protein HslJ
MRLTAIACIALSAHAAQASDVALDLAWPDMPPAAEVVAVTRDSNGDVLNALRQPLAADMRNTVLALPSLSRQAATLQVGAFVDGAPRLQSGRAEVAGGQPPASLTLDPVRAVTFRSEYLCDTGAVATTSPDGAGFALDMGTELRTFTETGLSAAFMAADGTVATRIPGLLQLEGPDGALQASCQPIPSRPVLPALALGEDRAWQVLVAPQGSTLTLGEPDSPAPDVPPTPLATTITFDSADTLAIRFGDYDLRLRNTPCKLPRTDMPYPYTADLTGPSPDAPALPGCAGNPLHALEGRPWQVEHIFGAAVPSGADGSNAFTLQFDAGRLTGRTSCNRFLGRARVEGVTLVLHDLGTTRLPCPANLRNLETRYLDALESATGFIQPHAGQLALYSGSTAVLIASR